MTVFKTVWAGVVGFFDMLDDAMRFRDETLKKNNFHGWNY